LSHSSKIYESATAIMKHITSNITCLHIYRPKEHSVQINISQMENVRMFVGSGGLGDGELSSDLIEEKLNLINHFQK